MLKHETRGCKSRKANVMNHKAGFMNIKTGATSNLVSLELKFKHKDWQVRAEILSPKQVKQLTSLLKVVQFDKVIISVAKISTFFLINL